MANFGSGFPPPIRSAHGVCDPQPSSPDPGCLGVSTMPPAIGFSVFNPAPGTSAEEIVSPTTEALLRPYLSHLEFAPLHPTRQRGTTG